MNTWCGKPSRGRQSMLNCSNYFCVVSPGGRFGTKFKSQFCFESGELMYPKYPLMMGILIFSMVRRVTEILKFTICVHLGHIQHMMKTTTNRNY